MPDQYGYKCKTDPGRLILSEEMDKFLGRVTPAHVYNPGLITFFSGWTPYGLQLIKEALFFRISIGNLPVTLLWHHRGYTSFHDEFDSSGNLWYTAPYAKFNRYVRLHGPNTTKGSWDIGPHYRPESPEKNGYPGDVKSAILSAPLCDDDKQELLDELFLMDDPVRMWDRHFCRRVRAVREGATDPTLWNDISQSTLPDLIKENLLHNLQT